MCCSCSPDTIAEVLTAAHASVILPGPLACSAERWPGGACPAVLLVLWPWPLCTPRLWHRCPCRCRFAALSVGRVEGGQLFCRYHGWGFKGGQEGRCSCNPQAVGAEAEATVLNSSRSRLESHPSQVCPRPACSAGTRPIRLRQWASDPSVMVLASQLHRRASLPHSRTVLCRLCVAVCCKWRGSLCAIPAHLAERVQSMSPPKSLLDTGCYTKCSSSCPC